MYWKWYNHPVTDVIKGNVLFFIQSSGVCLVLTVMKGKQDYFHDIFTLWVGDREPCACVWVCVFWDTIFFPLCPLSVLLSQKLLEDKQNTVTTNMDRSKIVQLDLVVPTIQTVKYYFMTLLYFIHFPFMIVKKSVYDVLVVIIIKDQVDNWR